MKVSIKNYQVIKQADLTFEPGVTVIIGSSNNGKSSIIRSIEAAINNKGGSDFIHYDAEACEVAIEDNGQKIIWSKNKNSNKSYYDINGQVLNKIGQKQLEEVGQLLNMSEIQVNNDKFRLNFWKQLEFPFLVGKTHYQLFDFISKSKDQELIANLEDETTTHIKNTNVELSDLNSKIDARTQDIINIKKEIEQLEKFVTFSPEDMEKMLQINNSLSQNITTYKKALETENQLLTQFFDIKDKYKDLKKTTTILEYELNDFNDLLSYKNTIAEIEKFKNVLNDINKKMQISEELYKEVLEKKEEIEKVEKSVIALYHAFKRLDSLENEINDATQLVYSIEDKIKADKEELSTFNVCPFCGSSLENHEVHND